MTDSPPKSLVLFIDRNSGGRTFQSLLKANGLTVILHDDHFTQKTSDEDWLAAAGGNGWIVITGDIATTRSPLFLQRLASSQAFVFILAALNGASAEGKANCIIDAYSKVERLVQTSRPPRLWKVSRDGAARQLDFQRTLARMKRARAK